MYLSMSSILLFIGIAVCAPSISEHHYFSGKEELLRPNYSTPITFKGSIIGAAELSSIAVSGTTHSLSDGHHFTHVGWYLTDTDGGVWEFLPDHQNSVMVTSKVRKQEAMILGIANKIFRWIGQPEDNALASFETLEQITGG